MGLNFCKKCGGMLRVQNIDENKNYLFCDKCSFFEIIKSNETLGMFSKEEIKKQEEKGVGIRKDKNEFATYKNICKKCGYDKSEIVDVGVLYSDEDNLILLKCGKCGFSERIGRKVN